MFLLLTSHLQWGAFTAVAGGVGYAVSPIYRGLTIQFKMYVTSDSIKYPAFAVILHHISSLTSSSYIQMSGMILGSMIEADKRMIAYEHHVRHQKRIRRDMEVWRRYEEDFENRGTPGVGAESNVKGKGTDV